MSGFIVQDQNRTIVIVQGLQLNKLWTGDGCRHQTKIKSQAGASGPKAICSWMMPSSALPMLQEMSCGTSRSRTSTNRVRFSPRQWRSRCSCSATPAGSRFRCHQMSPPQKVLLTLLILRPERLKREPRQDSTSIKVNYTDSISNNTIVLVVIPTLVNMKNIKL